MAEKKLKPVPRFVDEDEEREYWATHDLTEHFDLSQLRPVVFPNLKPSTETISLRLPAGLLVDLKVLANRMDVPYQSLMKVYLAERVHQELRRGRTPEQLAAMVREPEPPYGKAPVGTHRPAKRAARAAQPKARPKR